MTTVVTTAVTVGVLLGLMGLGLAAGRMRVDRTRERITRAREFLDLLTRYYTSNGADQAAYLELVRKSGVIQSDLGAYGIMSYQPPASNLLIHNYQIVVNQVVELPRGFRMRPVLSTIDLAHESASMIRDCLLRYLGEVERWEVRQRREIRNPIILLREGVRAVLGSPLWLAQSLGLLSATSAAAIRDSAAARIVSGLVTLLSVVSGIVGIVVGWSDFWAAIRRWLHLP